jgi:hypothetical protein
MRLRLIIAARPWPVDRPQGGQSFRHGGVFADIDRLAEIARADIGAPPTAVRH